MWDLGSLARDQPCIPCIGGQTLSPWTTMEVLRHSLLTPLRFSTPATTALKSHQPARTGDAGSAQGPTLAEMTKEKGQQSLWTPEAESLPGKRFSSAGRFCQSFPSGISRWVTRSALRF